VLLYQPTRDVALLETLLASNVDRNPYLKGGSSAFISNSVMYNWCDQAFTMADPDGAGPSLATFVNNYLKRGPHQSGTVYMVRSRYLPTGSQLYMAGNIADGDLVPFAVINGEGIDPRVNTPPVTIEGYTPAHGYAAFDTVLADAGARPLDRDASDQRVIAYVKSRGGPGAISHPDQVGGYPALAVNHRALTPPANPHVVQASGYTALEEWLHAHARAVETSSRRRRSADQWGY
jgi:hypothetical protein